MNTTSADGMRDAEKLYRQGKLLGDLMESEEPINPRIQEAFKKAVDRDKAKVKGGTQ